jgi:hypothetical protein
LQQNVVSQTDRTKWIYILDMLCGVCIFNIYLIHVCKCMYLHGL